MITTAEPRAWLASWLTLLLYLLIIAGAQGGCRSAVLAAEPAPSKPPAPETRREVSTPAEARERAAAAEGDAAYWRAYADQLVAAERQQQIETISTWLRWLAVLCLVGSTVLTVLSFLQPSLRPLRALAGGGAMAATVVLALAWVLPQWAPLLVWVAVVLVGGGLAHLLYRLWRTARAAEAAVKVAEAYKPEPGTETDGERILRLQRQEAIAGTGSDAVDEIRLAMGYKKPKKKRKVAA